MHDATSHFFTCCICTCLLLRERKRVLQVFLFVFRSSLLKTFEFLEGEVKLHSTSQLDPLTSRHLRRTLPPDVPCTLVFFQRIFRNTVSSYVYKKRAFSSSQNVLLLFLDRHPPKLPRHRLAAQPTMQLRPPDGRAERQRNSISLGARSSEWALNFAQHEFLRLAVVRERCALICDSLVTWRDIHSAAVQLTVSMASFRLECVTWVFFAHTN